MNPCIGFCDCGIIMTGCSPSPTAQGIAFHGSGPVSYTHLDVYKRQLRAFALCAFRRNGMSAVGAELSVIGKLSAAISAKNTHVGYLRSFFTIIFYLMKKYLSSS